MKKINPVFILLVLLSFGVISCSKEDDPGGRDFISASINDTKWTGTPEVSINQETDSLLLLGYGDDQGIFIKIKFKGEGNYDLENSQTGYSTTHEGDVRTSFYTFDRNSSSEFNITEYDPEQNILKGDFQLSLLKEWSNPENNIEKKIFRNGQFRATIQK